MLDEYLMIYNDEKETVDLLKVFLTTPQGLSKAHRLGHVTGSAWIINNSREMVLMTQHTKLNMWLQLGGHVEEGEHIIESAKREAREESGLESIILLDEHIFDIDAHLIPANATNEEHYHYDIRFLFEADSKEKLVISKESKNLKWIKLKNISKYNNDKSIIRMVNKTTTCNVHIGF